MWPQRAIWPLSRAAKRIQSADFHADDRTELRVGTLIRYSDGTLRVRGKYLSLCVCICVCMFTYVFGYTYIHICTQERSRRRSYAVPKQEAFSNPGEMIVRIHNAQWHLTGASFCFDFRMSCQCVKLD